jgi:hypothetical protein
MGKRVALARVKKHFVPIVALSLSALLTPVCLGPARAEDADQSQWPTKQWLTSTPEEQGMDSSALAKFVGYGGSHNFDSLLVVRHGRIVTEAYYAPYTADIPHEIFSSTKAVTGTLLGWSTRTACSTVSIIPCWIFSPIAMLRTSMTERKPSRFKTCWT